MAAPVIGLAPISPSMMPPPVVLMAAPARIVKWAVIPKLTGAGPAAINVWCGAAKAAARTRFIRICFVPFILSARRAKALDFMRFMGRQYLTGLHFAIG